MPFTIYQDPRDKKTMVKPQRGPEKNILPPHIYEEYSDRPYSETCKQIPAPTRLYWEDSARELCYSSRLLPHNPPDTDYPDAAQIVRTKYLECRGIKTYHFNGNFSKNGLKIKFQIREIDLTSIFGTNNFSPNPTAAVELVKDLYIQHFFQHENLRQALFTVTEPQIFRMNTAFARAIPLYNIAKKMNIHADFRETACPIAQYVPISVLRGLAYLHARNIVHGSVYIDNCYVNEKGNIVLAGFEKVSCPAPRSTREDIALSCFNNNRLSAGSTDDIWYAGTLTLDFFFAKHKWSNKKFSPNEVRPYGSLIEMWKANRPPPSPNDYLRGLPWADYETYPSQKVKDEIWYMGGTDSQMYDFIDFTVKRDNRPSAQWLLEELEFTAVLEPKFQAYKKYFIKKLEDFEFQIPPMHGECKMKNHWQAINTRRIRSVFKSDSQTAFFEDKTGLAYEPRVQTPTRKFYDGTEIKVSLAMYYPLHTSPIEYDAKITVGAEHTIFNLLVNLLDVKEPIRKIPENMSEYWLAINVTQYPFHPWDVFRIRKALLTMISDMAEDAFEGENGVEIDGELLTYQREFPLSDHPEKVKRHIEITMKSDRRDLVHLPSTSPVHHHGM